MKTHPVRHSSIPRVECRGTARDRHWITRGILAGAILIFLGMSAPRVSAQVVAETVARIRSIQASDSGLNVVVAVPAGSRRISLETRSRIARGTWT
ncbi:MAG: hypothetical protein ACKO3H_00820, partial [Verrucomicrobiota bacterium]